MPRSHWPQCHMDALEPRLCFAATWIVIPPGAGEVVVEQAVPAAAVDGLVHAAARANATAGGGFNCWIVRFEPRN